MAQPAQSLDLPDLFNFNSILLIEENGANSNNVIHNRQSIMLNGAPQTQCPECKLPITDQYFLAVDERSWHPTCLKCSACGCNLNEAVSCFVKYNRLYCKLDYEKNFLKNCIRCKSLIQANDVTMKVGSEDYYHARCFSCSACHQTLQTGEQFIRGNFGQLLCQLDAMQLLPDSYVIPTIPGPVNNLSVGEVQLPPPPSELVESTRSAVMPYSKYKARRKKDDFSDDGDASNMGLVDGNGRAKRMRTSFKHQQLKIMRHYFNLNQNPDSKDLKNLAVKTGLTKRVLQVYFQNARSA
uniref:Homeobox domain-containing protein n=1 Tax=Rhabditophanes sp. KR3021 TaxID=114890 RepID=A0AC35TRI8_9BILA